MVHFLVRVEELACRFTVGRSPLVLRKLGHNGASKARLTVYVPFTSLASKFTAISVSLRQIQLPENVNRPAPLILHRTVVILFMLHMLLHIPIADR